MKETIKRILVPLDPTVFSRAATKTACAIAKIHGARVSGVAVLDSPEIRASVIPAVGPYYPGLIDAVREKTKHAEAILQECLGQFARTCDEMGVEHLETEYEGIPAQKFLESAIFYDLIVVGLKTAFHFETRHEQLESLTGILDGTITPILAVPAKGLEKPEQVLITFDGSPGASRAVHDFARFAQPYDCRIKVAVAEKEADEAQFLLQNTAAFLRTHGFEDVETEAIDGPISDAVEKGVVEGVKLIVAGIHSRKFIQDLFVGSFTKSLIERGDIALFLSH